jgi:hypothetical protein
MSPQDAHRLVGNDIVDRLIDDVVYREHAHTYQRKSAQKDVEESRAALLAELERLRTALRAVRACTDPQWAAQLISDALRETP